MVCWKVTPFTSIMFPLNTHVLFFPQPCLITEGNLTCALDGPRCLKFKKKLHHHTHTYIYIYIALDKSQIDNCKFIHMYIYKYKLYNIYIYIVTWLRARVWCCMTHLSIYLSIYLSIHPSIHLSIYPSIHLSIDPSIHPSIYLSICIIYIYVWKWVRVSPQNGYSTGNMMNICDNPF